MSHRPWKVPSLKHAVASLEDGIIVLSGPALAISGIIAGVDLVTGGNVLKSVSWLGLVWAITLLLTLDFQVLALGVRAHRVYSSGKHAGQKVVEILLVVLIAAAISFVSIQMQSIIARVNAEAGLSIDQAAVQLGINTIALIWERSTLVLVLIFMSGWLREHPEEQTQTLASPPAPVPHPAISEETVQLILARLATLDRWEQALTAQQQQAQTGQVTISEQARAVRQLAAPAQPHAQAEAGQAQAPPGEQEQTLENPPAIFHTDGEESEAAPPIYSERFQSKEQVIAAILAQRPGASAEEIAQEADCTVRTAAKWMQRLQVSDQE
jgi:transposase